MYHACLKGFRDIVSLLLDCDADVSVANNSSETPLHAAAKSGNKEIIGKLVQYGADLDATDKEGRTPLIRLLDNKRTDAALFLIEQGADTEITDNSGHKAVDYATAHGLREVVLRLSVGTSDIHGNTPLHQAVFNGQSETVRILLSTSDDMLNIPNDEGETPLIIACMKGNLTVAKLLIDAGADVNKALLNGNTPLHFAVWSGNKFVGRDLIGTNAQIDAQNENGETPLILAAKEGNNEFVALRGASSECESGRQFSTDGIVLCQRAWLQRDYGNFISGRSRRIIINIIKNLKRYDKRKRQPPQSPEDMVKAAQEAAVKAAMDKK